MWTKRLRGSEWSNTVAMHEHSPRSCRIHKHFGRHLSFVQASSSPAQVVHLLGCLTGWKNVLNSPRPKGSHEYLRLLQFSLAGSSWVLNGQANWFVGVHATDEIPRVSWSSIRSILRRCAFTVSASSSCMWMLYSTGRNKVGGRNSGWWTASANETSTMRPIPAALAKFILRIRTSLGSVP